MTLLASFFLRSHLTLKHVQEALLDLPACGYLQHNYDITTLALRSSPVCGHTQCLHGTHSCWL